MHLFVSNVVIKRTTMASFECDPKKKHDSSRCINVVKFKLISLFMCMISKNKRKTQIPETIVNNIYNIDSNTPTITLKYGD